MVSQTEDPLISYTRRVLQSRPEYEIVECSWNYHSVSPLHHHGWSKCTVTILEGVFENRLRVGPFEETEILSTGDVLSSPIGAQHEFRCISENGGKTLHHYFPRITELSDIGRVPNEKSLIGSNDAASQLLLGDEPSSWNAVERTLKLIESSSVSTHSPKFMNQLFSGIWPSALRCAEVASRTRTTLATFEASPVFTTLELELVRALINLCGWTVDQSDGISLPGGSAANMMAIHCARARACPDQTNLKTSSIGFEVYCSAHAHYSVKKSALALGLGLASVREIPVDSSGRIDVSALVADVKTAALRGKEPLAVVLTAGTTVLGAFDCVDSVVDALKSEDIWIHVDGAWGGPAVFSSQFSRFRKSLSRVHSWSIDSHKLLGGNLAHSMLLCRDRHVLLAANDVTDGGYLFHHSQLNHSRGRLGWQCGRAPDFLHFWAVWRLMGARGLGEFVDSRLSVAKELAEYVLAQSSLELVQRPEFLNVCVRLKHSDGSFLSKEEVGWIRESLLSSGLAMVNMATDGRGAFLRFVVAHPDQQLSHFELPLKHCADLVARQFGAAQSLEN